MRAVGFAHRQVRADRLDQLAADRVQRIERGQRILEDGADLAPAHDAHRFVRQVVDAPAREADLAAGDAPRRVDQPDDRGAGQRLARARFADDAQHFAGRDRERDVVHGDERAAARRELDAQALDGEQRLAPRRVTSPRLLGRRHLAAADRLDVVDDRRPFLL